jgi:hypothetical protein
MQTPKKAALAALAGAGLLALPARGQTPTLLIPDSGGDRISAFSPVDGAVVNLDFIPKDGRMKQVVQVAQTPWNTLLMTDFEANSIWEYDFNGLFLGTFVDTATLGFPTAPGASRGVQGICIAYGKVWFTFNDVTGTGADNRNAIWSVEFDGSDPHPVCTAVDHPQLGQLRGILPWNGGFLVADSGNASGLSDDLEFVSLTCQVETPTFYNSALAGASELFQFPQQVSAGPDGRLLVACFSSSAGVHEIDPATHTLWRYRSAALSLRGVHLLEDGDWIATGGTKVVKIAPFSGASSDIVNVAISGGFPFNGSFRWVSRVDIPPVCFGDLDLSGSVDNGDIAFALLDYGPCPGCQSDLDASGEVDFGDVALILLSMGPCS